MHVHPRTACLQAYEHEVPLQQFLASVPSIAESFAGPLSYEVFGEDIVAGWVSEFRRILTAAMADPGREWRTL